MGILASAIETETQELHQQGAQLRHIGDLTGLDPSLQTSIRDAIELTRHNDRLVLTLAFNYGGRQELLHAIKAMLRDGVDPDDLTEETVSRYLFTAGTPEPDLIIRTSGECRMSNFLLWQASFAELYFSSLFWPDFGPGDLEAAVQEFGRRERRFGHVSSVAAAGLE
jgi:undecaprenyl diphosphate synthase